MSLLHRELNIRSFANMFVSHPFLPASHRWAIRTNSNNIRFGMRLCRVNRTSNERYFSLFLFLLFRLFKTILKLTFPSFFAALRVCKCISIFGSLKNAMHDIDGVDHPVIFLILKWTTHFSHRNFSSAFYCARRHFHFFLVGPKMMPFSSRFSLTSSSSMRTTK